MTWVKTPNKPAESNGHVHKTTVFTKPIITVSEAKPENINPKPSVQNQACEKEICVCQRNAFCGPPCFKIP